MGNKKSNLHRRTAYEAIGSRPPEPVASAHDV